MNAEAPFLAEVRESLRKRRKAIKHRSAKVSIERVIERADDGETEKLEIGCSFHGTSTRLDLHIWEDRWIWIGAGRSRKIGWSGSLPQRGRLLGSRSARDLVASFEASLSANYWDEQAPVELDKLWAAALATGPKLVR